MLRFGLYSGKIELGKNRIGFKLSMARFEFGVSIFNSLWVRSLHIGFELGRVISSVGYFNSCYHLSFVWLWIGLLRVFGSKFVHPISGVVQVCNPIVWFGFRVSGQFCRVYALAMVH